MSDEWRVDPDRVLGILAGIDEDGKSLLNASHEARDLRDTGTVLQVDGRTVMSTAWSKFWAIRCLTPGKLIYVMSRAAEAVSDATTAVVAGDLNMAQTEQEAADYALSTWGIRPPSDYISNGTY